ncbi:uncharacterized protein B0T15DRAFT_34582 [Chaetomium strumarium]|uniref:F-box domain-containing protein n=1 Tax=Chaetomium strumarium TaxID=1170767 RepID=A0AAJ0H202_9PEZI|nr:hypothetical protein B0T15DRAFT_34582 [Chaetomium strumarium]
MQATKLTGHSDMPAGTENSSTLESRQRSPDDRSATANLPTSDATIIGRKRKLSDQDEGPTSTLSETAATASVKKTKLAGGSNAQSSPSGCLWKLDKSLLPSEVWHHIFTFCPPKSLGSLSAVNRLFNLYLDPASSVRRDVPSSPTRGVLEPLEPNAIWQASRRLFWPKMPAPLRSMTELDMWRLACSPKCQGCGKLDARGQTSLPNLHHPGPDSGVVPIIWAFGVRMCGPCIIRKSTKEVDLLLSPFIPSALLPALPFVFLSQNLDFFSPTMLKQGQLPADVQVTKWFLSSDVEALEKEFIRVKEMGQGTVNEWLKGLESRGNDLQNEATKWEKWESTGGIAQMCSRLYQEYARKSPVSLPPKPFTDSTLPTPVLRPSFSQARQERTAAEVAELKAARKAEIERRALLLDPPLTADVLRHIPAFQASTHIVSQLDDDAWERLKPRLLAQRADAERARQEERKAEPWIHEKPQEQQHLETTLATTKEARDRVDKEWEEVQAPLRARIAGYADEIIQNSWDNGKKVTRATCSRFAVDSLIYVRKRFYGEVANDAVAARASGKTLPVDPPEGPFTQKLTLENMKWIFDTKIRPHTEPFRKELFYCNGCEGNPKPFTFEGVIQHYAAKHTDELSLRSIVVHWRAEWPEHPPFSATARPAPYPHVPGRFPVNGGAPLPASYHYPPTGIPPVPPAVYGPATGYGYTPPTYNDYYQPPPPPPVPYHPPLAAPTPHFAPQPAAYPPYQPPAMQYPGPAAEPPQGYMPLPNGQPEYYNGPYQPLDNGGGPYAPPPPPVYPDLYHNKVEDIARNSREVWRQLGDIRELPGSVRVFVTIHHLVKRFRSRFYETPPLSMFIDGLSNNKEMRPVRNVNGLACKACRLRLGNADWVEQDRKSFSLPQLANHFQSKHVEPMQRMQAQTGSVALDWVLDMVLLPDPASLSSLASSVNETQRALLTAALPSAFAPQPVSATTQSSPRHWNTQHEQSSDEGYPPMPARAPAGATTTNGYAGPPDAGSKHSTTGASVGAGVFGDSSSSGPTPHGATPCTMSENERSAKVEGDRPSSLGFRPVHDQNGFNHRKATGKNTRGKPQRTGGSGDRTFGKQVETAAINDQPEGTDLHAPRPTPHGGTSPIHASSARSERARTKGVPQAQQALKHNARPGQRPDPEHQVSPTIGDHGPSIVAALESRLEQHRSPPFQARQGPMHDSWYKDRRNAIASPDFQGVSGRPAGHSRMEGRAGPGAESQYQASEPLVRERSPAGRQVGGGYYSRPLPAEMREDEYAPQRNRAGLMELSSRYSEGGRFSTPVAPSDDRGHGHGPVRPEAEYRRYHEEMRMPSRGPIEAYEIVQVIDEHGEYYIRRPVRREPGTRYIYEERGPHRDADAYHSLEPVYAAAIARPSRVREQGRASVAPELWLGDCRADPAYYEEYDPRFPAA